MSGTRSADEHLAVTGSEVADVKGRIVAAEEEAADRGQQASVREERAARSVDPDEIAKLRKEAAALRDGETAARNRADLLHTEELPRAERALEEAELQVALAERARLIEQYQQAFKSADAAEHSHYLRKCELERTREALIAAQARAEELGGDQSPPEADEPDGRLDKAQRQWLAATTVAPRWTPHADRERRRRKEAEAERHRHADKVRYVAQRYSRRELSDPRIVRLEGEEAVAEAIRVLEEQAAAVRREVEEAGHDYDAALEQGGGITIRETTADGRRVAVEPVRRRAR